MYVLTDIKHTYLCYSASKVDSICLFLSQKPDEHGRIEPRKRHLAHVIGMERSPVQHHLVHLGSIPAGIDGLVPRYRPATISAL